MELSRIKLKKFLHFLKKRFFIYFKGELAKPEKEIFLIFQEKYPWSKYNSKGKSLWNKHSSEGKSLWSKKKKKKKQIQQRAIKKIKRESEAKNSPLVLWKKSFVQSFVVFWSFSTKLWSYKVLNLVWVTSCPRMYKAFQLWFCWHIFVNFMEKQLFTQFYGRLDCFDHDHVLSTY